MERSASTITLSDLIEASAREDWDFVDAHISGHANNPDAIAWAIQDGMNDTDGNIRDLAVSLLERSSTELSSETIQKLYSLFDDENRYVGFRSAFALFTHNERSSLVLTKINEALLDEDVSDIAEGYLAEI